MTYRRRVVITGCGAISPLGNTVADLVAGLREGRSGVHRLERIPADALPVSYGAEAKSFTEKIDEFGPLEASVKKQIRKGLKVMCREIKMAVAAAQHAITDAQLELGSEDRERIGVSFGSDYIATLPDEFVDPIRECIVDGEFQFQEWAEAGLPKVTPLWLLKYLPNMPACHVAIYNDLRGPSNSVTLREASSNLVIGEAATTIGRGIADVIVTGATGCRIHPLRSVHIAIQEELARGYDENPGDACRPFDQQRQGSVLGEGAAVVVLEELDHARQRGARILGEVLGHGSSAVLTKDCDAESGQAVSNAIQQTLRTSNSAPNEIGHVHAHGLGDRKTDQLEARGIAAGLQDSKIPVIATKGNLGNTGAACGMIELIASLFAMEQGDLFPIRNLRNPDPNCPLQLVVDKGVPAGSSVLNVNLTPQGQASCVIVRRFDE